MEGRGKEASGESFARTTGKRPRTKDDWGTGNQDVRLFVPKRLIKRVSIATATGKHFFPGRTRSIETKPLATHASRQATHSNAEPRASSKKLGPRLTLTFPVSSAVFRSTERRARSSCSLNSRRCWGSKLLRKDGRMDEGSKRAANQKEKDASGGSFGCVPAGNDRGQRTTTSTLESRGPFWVRHEHCRE
jgi:hypothetical protein